MLLRKGGFKMADKRKKNYWTEGYHVKRRDFTSVVLVDYYASTSQYAVEVIRSKREAALREALEFLRARGYPLSDAGEWDVSQPRVYSTERKAG